MHSSQRENLSVFSIIKSYKICESQQVRLSENYQQMRHQDSFQQPDSHHQENMHLYFNNIEPQNYTNQHNADVRFSYDNEKIKDIDVNTML